MTVKYFTGTQYKDMLQLVFPEVRSDVNVSETGLAFEQVHKVSEVWWSSDSLLSLKFLVIVDSVERKVKEWFREEALRSSFK